ncbi:hypothetical protein CYQ88_11385, partial [Hydrogenovibrio sp. SC-1]|uniref:carbohydrate porin n=1 Tax=Hydrogenovibrio sp. SC-1 TaxID=2065820 RepID=UPI000CBC0E3B
FLILFPIYSCLLFNQAYAGEGFGYDGGLSFIYQSPNTSALESGSTLSGDFGVYYDFSNISLHSHIEGCTTPAQTTAGHLLPQSNGDAGSALDSRNKGRIQLSEFFMTWHATPETSLSTGMIDATAYMDSSFINNDETTQFISAPLVNNPIIDFPDYALGVVVQHALSDNYFGRILVSSSHGLADNPSRNYSQAFEIGQDHKGMFLDGEVSYTSSSRNLTLGLWTHTAPHESLSDSSKTNLQNYGVYLNAYQSFDQHSFEGRIGYANPEVSSGEVFTSLVYEYQRADWVFGSGYSCTKMSNHITDKGYRDNNQTLEVYLRYRLEDSFDITPSLQYFEHPVYNHDEVQLSNSLWSANLRLSYFF